MRTYQRFVNAESKQNLDVGLEIVRGAGHFDVVAPFAPAWKVVQQQIVELAGLNE